MNIHMTDPDNRDDRGVPFELRGSVARVIKYLDGPLRRDTREGSHSYIDMAIAALNEERIDVATAEARQVGVNLAEITGELPEVIDLGEDFDLWFVTGTSDAHSAEEAVRAYWATVLDGEDLQDMFDLNSLGALGLQYRKDWAWKHPAGTPVDAEPDDASVLVSFMPPEGAPRFAGYLVTL